MPPSYFIASFEPTRSEPPSTVGGNDLSRIPSIVGRNDGRAFDGVVVPQVRRTTSLVPVWGTMIPSQDNLGSAAGHKEGEHAQKQQEYIEMVKREREREDAQRSQISQRRILQMPPRMRHAATMVLLEKQSSKRPPPFQRQSSLESCSYSTMRGGPLPPRPVEWLMPAAAASQPAWVELRATRPLPATRGGSGMRLLTQTGSQERLLSPIVRPPASDNGPYEDRHFFRSQSTPLPSPAGFSPGATARWPHTATNTGASLPPPSADPLAKSLLAMPSKVKRVPPRGSLYEASLTRAGSHVPRRAFFPASDRAMQGDAHHMC